MRIVVDAMGSDCCPEPDVAGAVEAARDIQQQGLDDVIILTGQKPLIERELAKYDTSRLNLEIVHASQAIDMHDKPGRAGRAKPDSSMMVGMNLVRDGQADAFVTAGNTGAALTLATLHTLQRVPGVQRPALTSIIQVDVDSPVVLVDLGANTDSRPEWLVQFGIMGSLYAERVLGRQKPRVALLSNGEEEGKGNALVRETGVLLPQSGINFVGNVEPKEVLRGAVDVVVADGFVGNVMLKSLEALGDTLFRLLRRELRTNPLRLLGALLIRPALRKVYRQMDPFEVGGAPLLGVNGVVIVGHGRTNAKGIKNAISQARRAVQGNIISAIRDGISRYVVPEAALESTEAHRAPVPERSPRRRGIFHTRFRRRVVRHRSAHP